MRNIRLTIEYDGTAYHGWQSQENAVAIQDVVNAAVNRLTGEECTLYGSSRTDAGVHAYGQVVNFRTASGIPADKFAFALNTMLPGDVSVVRSEEAEPGFHARFSARGKKYRYMFCNSMFPSAIMRNRAWHTYYPLDVEAMRRAAENLVGTHDFLAFSASGSSVKTTVRTMFSISVNGSGSGFPSAALPSAKSQTKPEGSSVIVQSPDATGPEPSYIERDASSSCISSGPSLPATPVAPSAYHVAPGYAGIISLDIEGDGFLYNMVRIIAGTLVEVGYGKIMPGDIPGILESRDRRRAGITAPPQGLYLMEVYY